MEEILRTKISYKIGCTLRLNLIQLNNNNSNNNNKDNNDGDDNDDHIIQLENSIIV